MKRQRILGLAACAVLFFAWTCQHARTIKKQPVASVAAQHEKKKQSVALNSNEHFGKTHFIVGCPSSEYSAPRKQKTSDVAHEGPFGLISDGHVKQAFFAPDDDVQKVLLHLIDAEKKHISVAIYAFTDKAVAHALVRAVKRGVSVEFVVDSSCLQERYNKVGILRDSAVPIYVYDMIKRQDGKHSLMHNKFIVFSHNILEKSLVWTGSYNFTNSARERNQENALVCDEPWLVAKYVRQFQRLKGRSIRYAFGKKAHA